MHPDKVVAKLDSTLAAWRALLEPLDEDAFARQPAGGGWTSGQICRHVGDASAMLLENAAQWYQLNEMHVRHHLRQLRRALTPR